MRPHLSAWLLAVAAMLVACDGRSATAPNAPALNAASAPAPAPGAASAPAPAPEAPRKLFASGPEADPDLAAFVERNLLELNGRVWDELHATASERAKARGIVLESLRRARSLEDRRFSGRVTEDEDLQEFTVNQEWEAAQYVSLFGKERAEERARIFERLQREWLKRVEPDAP